MSTVPPGVRTSMQQVSPPYLALAGAGAGTEPRAPQILTCNGDPFSQAQRQTFGSGKHFESRPSLPAIMGQQFVDFPVAAMGFVVEEH